MRGEMNGWTKQLLSKGEFLHELHGSWLGQLRMAPVKDTDELSFSSYSVYYSPSAFKSISVNRRNSAVSAVYTGGGGQLKTHTGASIYLSVTKVLRFIWREGWAEPICR